MPELPDVERFKQYFNATSLHKTITEVEVHHRRVLENVSAGFLRESLAGASFAETERIGKYLFARLTLQSETWLVLHFGMTGYLKYFQSPGDNPEHERLLVSFENGYFLAYVCQRLLGKISITASPEKYAADTGLGPDAASISREQFARLFSGGRGAVKSALMNQKKIAGLGNIYTDELLFQARVHPETEKTSLSRETKNMLYEKMGEILSTAIDNNADVGRFPSSYLLPHREKNAKCPNCGGYVKKIKVGGRGTFFCPACQSK
jgi:formamidopyrimidine-DNA glycosylase